MTFKLPEQGNKINRFERLRAFISQFNADWPEYPKPAAREAIERLKIEANIENRVWPEEYQWFAENFGRSGIEFNFCRNYSFPPIAQNYRLNREYKNLPYLFIGSAWIASPYIAYHYSDDKSVPDLVWVPSFEVNACYYRAADTLEQLLFSCAFLDEAYYEYEWKGKCGIPSEAVKEIEKKLGQPNELNYEKICAALVEIFSAVLKAHDFQCAWFSTYSDQFWFKDDVCFIVSRHNDPDSISDFIEGRIGSHSRHSAEKIISIMRGNSFSCSMSTF